MASRPANDNGPAIPVRQTCPLDYQSHHRPHASPHVPPPQETEQGAIIFSFQKWWAELQLDPSPPHTPHTSTVRLEPIRRSHPSGCGRVGSGQVAVTAEPGSEVGQISRHSGCRGANEVRSAGDITAAYRRMLWNSTRALRRIGPHLPFQQVLTGSVVANIRFHSSKRYQSPN